MILPALVLAVRLTQVKSRHPQEKRPQPLKRPPILSRSDTESGRSRGSPSEFVLRLPWQIRCWCHSEGRRTHRCHTGKEYRRVEDRSSRIGRREQERRSDCATVRLVYLFQTDDIDEQKSKRRLLRELS